MKVNTFPSPFGSPTRTQILLALELLSESYARELARFLALNLSTVQKAVGSLEDDGLVVGRAVGRTRVLQLNPRAAARQQLRRYLAALLESEPELRGRAARLRRRPRRTGKPL
jgi:DNA-binding transcriptional ArsR family regulator